MPARKRRILVIDDSPTMRKLFELTLRAEPDVELREAADGMAGLRLLKAEDFDLAFVDINMPVLDGLRLVELVRADPTLADLKIVIVTSEGSDAKHEHAMQLGANAYLTKPVQGHAVREMLKMLL